MIIQDWMKKLGYPEGSSKWIRPYHFLMSECDKNLTAEAFHIPGDENNECTILVATDAYGMGIDNPNVKLVVQWDFPLSFDSMIQRMGRARRKGGQAFFLLFTPKWSRIKDPKEVEERKSKNSKDATAANAQLSDKNRPISRMNQVLNADNELSEADTDTSVETDSDTGVETGSGTGYGPGSGAGSRTGYGPGSDAGSRTGYGLGSEAGSEPDFELDNADKADLVSGVLATEADEF